MKETFLHEFSQLAASPDRDLARPALMIARLECAQLDPAPYLHQLDAMGAAARERLRASGCLQDARTSETAIDVLNAYLFDEEGFTGNRERYDDPCNSFLNEVLERHTGDEAAFDPALLAPATKPQMLSRMLLNLKRIYVRLHSFPQARNVTELLLAVDPPGLAELRDRGLLAYHMNDFSAALRDLQQYLHFTAGSEVDEEGRSDHEQLWEHVKTLRRRVASLN